MVVRFPDTEQQADRLFHALADTTRRDIVRRVLVQEQSVSSLAAPYDMSFAAVQKHVALLEDVGLVRKRRRGREQLVRGDADTIDHVRKLLDELEQVWRDRIAAIGDVLADDPEQERT